MLLVDRQRILAFTYSGIKWKTFGRLKWRYYRDDAELIGLSRILVQDGDWFSSVHVNSHPDNPTFNEKVQVRLKNVYQC